MMRGRLQQVVQKDSFFELGEEPEQALAMMLVLQLF